MMRSSLFAFFALILVAAPMQNTAQAGEFAQQSETFITKLADKAVTSLKTVSSDQERVKVLKGLLYEGFDIEHIGRWVMGRAWRKANEDQRSTYLDVFGDFVVLTYAKRFNDLGNGSFKIDVTESIVKNGKDAMVRSAISTETSDQPIIIDWRLKKSADDTIKIIDVVVAGVSMSQAQRSEFASVIKRQGGVDGLIKALQDKVSAMKESLK